MEDQYVEEELRIDTPSGGYVYGILTKPKLAPTNVAGSRVVLIAHGFGGHKDYCYQKQLAHSLAELEMIYSFRFDFRGCGKSSPVAFPEEGRTVTKSDFEDFETIIDVLTGRGFVLGGIVGHSRGSVAMFYWAMNTKIDAAEIPTLVNVSGRFDSQSFLARIKHYAPEYKSTGWNTKINLDGEYVPANIKAAELEDLGSIDLSNIANLPRHVHVLSVYGLKDTIIPLIDADTFSQVLKPRHTLRLVQDADHNFYQMVEDNTVRINHNDKVVDMIVEWFDAASERERFMQHHTYTAWESRWKQVDGVNNFRDFGGFQRPDGTHVKTGILYRCANPARVSPQGADTMRQMNVKTVFDLRSQQELGRSGSLNVDGIETRWTPIFRDRDLSPEALAKRALSFSDPADGFMKAYRELLEKAGPPYKQIMEHIRDRPNDGFAVHCTAGKDRTGVICALILLLMGVPADTVAREYELTTQGLAPEIPHIVKAIEKDESNAMTTQQQLILLGSRYESMRGTILIVNEEYGGAYNWFKTKCGLSDADLQKIISNLTVKGAQQPLKYCL